MAPCCNNTVTPRLIKSGRVSVGDRIQMEEDIMVSGEAAAEQNNAAMANASKDPASIPASAPVQADIRSEASGAEEALRVASGAYTQAAKAPQEASQGKEYIAAAAIPEGYSGIVGIPGGIVNNRPSDTQNSTDQLNSSNHWYQAPIYGINAANSERMQFDPLPYSQMTSYMGNVSLGGTVESPSIVTPQVPMTPDGYDEEIDFDTVHALNGFLRTQIGRYMRVEQLVGSNTIQDRYGFLVGVGTNFIILQEITTGNIMVLDIFSIRLTYVYYSPPVIPNI